MIVVISESPDQVTAAILSDIVLNACLNVIITMTKKKMPGKFILQSENPFDLVRNIFQKASQKADNKSKRIPIIFGLFGRPESAFYNIVINASLPQISDDKSPA